MSIRDRGGFPGLSVGLLAAVFAAELSQYADMTPLAATGFNCDLVVEKTASGPPYNSAAVELNPAEGNAYYESGLAVYTGGLPSGGTFASALGDGTRFQLQPYDANNALVLSANTGLSSGTLTLLRPATFSRIAVIANSASGGDVATLRLNFVDGSSYQTFYNAQDWFNNANFALQGFQRIRLSSGATEGGTTNPRFYQTTIDIAGLLGPANKPLASITFDDVPSAKSTAIYAVSGEVAPDSAPAFKVEPADVTVVEAHPAEFTSIVSGSPFPALQWLRDGTPIPGATAMNYVLPSVALTDHGAIFQLVASNLLNGISQVVTSRAATLTVNADATPPSLVGAYALGTGQVRVSFSERLDPATANLAANYALLSTNSSPEVSAATLDTTQTNVVLMVSSMVEGGFYTVSVSNVTDLAGARNVIAEGSQASFYVTIYVPAGVGDPQPPGGLVPAGHGVNLAGGGAGIKGSSDQFQFAYALADGDFDVCVRLESLGLADAWTEAGLMARLDLSPGSPFAAILATPSISGACFRSRASSGAIAASTGSLPVNYPRTWLRLKRAGNQFTGFGGFDGRNWTQLGAITLSAPSTVYLGFAVSSRNSGQLSTAAFRDYSGVTAAATHVAAPFETLGQCSRLTSLVISEIMYHPAVSAARLEFIELFNSRGEPEDISGYRLSGAVDYTFPKNTVIPGGGFLVVARAPADLEAAYGISGVLGPWKDAVGLPNDRGTIRLRHRTGAVFLEVNYEGNPPWPVAADGAGHSLVLAHPSLGEGDPRAWAASSVVGGSPGRWDPMPSDPLDDVLINEILAHTDPPLEDYVELYNHGLEPKDLSGCWLSDEPATNKFRIPDGTVLPPRGFIAFGETDLGFALASAGERIFLVNSNRTRVLQALDFGPQENGVAFGRVPDGGPEFCRLRSRTPGAPNSEALAPTVVINEIMFHPISGDDDDQYVELYNRTDAPVDISGWRLSGDIRLVFPAATAIPPRGYVVAARDAARLRTNYTQLNLANCFGDFSGKLSHGGGRIALAMPHVDVVTNDTALVTNTMNIVVNEVTYPDASHWSRWADGRGSSLELIDPDSDNRLAANWADSDESGKAPWALISRTGTVDNTSTTTDQLQVLLQGAGECLIDNVEVIVSGNNRIANSTFDAGATGWTAEGTESGSGWETAEGYNSPACYHVRAVARGDNQLNRIRTPLTSSIPSGTQNVTIRAWVRWLVGAPEIILRFRGNGLELSGQMALPQNPGTPGLPNSRLVRNAPPAIWDVRHSPVLPAPGEPIIVSARCSDADGVSAFYLKYRVDPATNYITLALRDDGTGGDLVAGDGLYSATIPGQSDGTMIAFYVAASDAAPAPASSTYPVTVPSVECLVRVGEVQPTGNFPVYRLWMTQATKTAWLGRSKLKNLDNTPLPITFVLGNERVIYNSEAVYAGSPYIAPGFSGPTSGRCGYSVNLPADDLFLGERALVLDWPGGHNSAETTAMQEQMGYWIADRLDMPYSHRYIIRLHINGVTDTARNAVFEAVMQPAGKFIEAWSPNAPNGDFFKIDRAFEFSDTGSLITAPMPSLQNFTTTGGAKKTERYRWTFQYRSTNRTHDYTNIFSLVDALNATSPEPYTSATYTQVDVEEWMRVFAAEHIIVNFDAYGHEIGKNTYAYVPDQGKWQLYMFDLDWLMLAAASRGSSYAASNAPLFNADDPAVTRMFSHPPFLRAYWRAVLDAADGPFDPAVCNPVMDAKYQSLLANGVAWCDGKALTSPAPVKTWFSQRRTFLYSQVSPYTNVAFNVDSPSVTSNVAILSGTATIAVESIWINGFERPLTWPDVRSWKTSVPLQPGTNNLVVLGKDLRGQLVPGASNFVTVVYNGNVPYPVGQVLINEWMADNLSTLADPADGDFEDWFELYNPGITPVDLSGYFLTDSLTNQFQFQVPTNRQYIIAPKQFLLVWADGEKGQNATNRIDLHVPFKLDKEGESIALFAPDGTLIDAVTFGAQATDVSQGRMPDGGTSIQTLAAASPGGINLPPAPEFSELIISGSQATLSFDSVAGVRYWLESAEVAGGADWFTAAGPMVGNGQEMTVQVPVEGPVRFYRLRVE